MKKIILKALYSGLLLSLLLATPLAHSSFEINSARWIAVMVKNPSLIQFLTSVMSGRTIKEIQSMPIEQQQNLYNSSIAGLPPALSKKVSSFVKKLESKIEEEEHIKLENLFEEIRDYKRQIP